MSLDVYLINDTPITKRGSGVFTREGGKTRELTIAEVKERWPDSDIEERQSETQQVYWRNITHNLNTMADAAGIYHHLWRPDELELTKARHLIAPLAKGLESLLAKPQYYKTFNPENGWGTYEGLVEFVKDYLTACIQYPDATIEISR